MDEARHLYDQIAKRTAGSIYIGVVGPVRTGKSTFIKRFMEQLVLPHLENTYQRDRARDELPQSGSGRTIMTTEPKFVPEQAVEISPDGVSKLKVRLIADAGGDYIYKKNTSNRSLPIDLEEAYMLTAQADMWLNAGSAASLGELKSQFPKFANTRCVRNGAVYNCNKRLNAAGGNDYWESGVVRPDVVLHDLIAIMHPEALDENDRELHYYQRLE